MAGPLFRGSGGGPAILNQSQFTTLPPRSPKIAPIQGSIATFADGKVGIDTESRLLFCDNPRHMEFLAPMTPKAEVVEKVKGIVKRVELMKENLEGNRAD